MRMTRPSSLLRALCASLLLTAGYAAAQQPINADLITRGTLAPARIADGTLGSAKLGGDIGVFGRTLIASVNNTAARASLGLVIGADVQAYDVELAALAGLISAADRLPYYTGSGTAALATFTAAGRALVGDADNVAQRARLGLGGAAVLNVGTASGTVAAGDDSRLTNDRTASGLRTASSVVSVSAASAPTAGQVLTATSGTAAAWATPATGGVSPGRTISTTAPLTGGGDLSVDRTLSINEATTSTPGSMSAADKTKLDSIASGATANASDAALRDRSTHTGSQAAGTISDFASASRTQAEAALIAGDNISITPAGTGATRTLTIASTAAGVTDGSVTDAKVAAGAAIAESKLALASDAAAGVPSRRTLGTGALQAAAGNDARLSDARVPTDGSVTDAKVAAGAAIAESKLSLASDAAAGTPSRRTLGTGALQAAAGNDARLSDARVPTDGSVTDAKVAAGAAIAESKLALASDAAAGVPSRRTLGTGALQAAAGNDARLSDQRVPTDGSVTTTKLNSSLLTAFNGKLGAAETGGATLAFGAVPDGAYLRRSGTSLVGDPAGSVSAFKLASRTGSETDRPSASGNAGRAIRLVNLGTGSGYARSIWQESDGTTWGNVNGVATFYSDWTPASPITLPDTTQQAIGPTITVPAGLLGPKSQIRILPHVRASAAQSGNALRVFLGGQILYLSGGGWFESTPRVVVTNAGSTGAQTRNGIGNNSTGWGGSNTDTYSAQLALDTTTDLNITFTVTGVATNTMTFMGVTVEVVNP